MASNFTFLTSIIFARIFSSRRFYDLNSVGVIKSTKLTFIISHPASRVSGCISPVAYSRVISPAKKGGSFGGPITAAISKGKKGFGFVIAYIITFISSKVPYFFIREDIVKLRARAVARIPFWCYPLSLQAFDCCLGSDNLLGEMRKSNISNVSLKGVLSKE